MFASKMSALSLFSMFLLSVNVGAAPAAAPESVELVREFLLTSKPC